MHTAKCVASSWTAFSVILQCIWHICCDTVKFCLIYFYFRPCSLQYVTDIVLLSDMVSFSILMTICETAKHWVFIHLLFFSFNLVM